MSRDNSKYSSIVTYSGVVCEINRGSRFTVKLSFGTFVHVVVVDRPPLWFSGQSFWLQIQRSRVRFPALPDFLSSSGSGTGSTQPREFN